MPDQVFVHNLTLNMSVGIYEREKQQKQRVIVNVTLDIATNPHPQSIKDVVSYEDITNKIITLSKEKHYDLLEEFAEHIAQICLSEEKVLSVTIKLEKPDIIKETKSVGIQIKRPN